MRIRLGCRLTYELPKPTPMVLMLNVHHSRASDLERPDIVTTTPTVPFEGYRDQFGNWCVRLVAPAGSFQIWSEGVLRDTGASDPVQTDALQVPVEFLPVDVLSYLTGSRYCETDLLSDFAWTTFGDGPEGWNRVQAICNWVHSHVRFDYAQARATRTAAETLREGVGVCRDFTHLAVALCRAMNIPTRYCMGYVSDIGQPPPYAQMDLAAWMEVFLDGQWWTFDPRNNKPIFGRVLIGRGRDAADVPITQTFGSHTLTGFEVWIDEDRKT